MAVCDHDWVFVVMEDSCIKRNEGEEEEVRKLKN